MKPLTQEELSHISALAALGFTYKQVAEMMEIDVHDFIDNVKVTGTEINKAYNSGFYETELKKRKKYIELAVDGGSSPAQVLLEKIFKNSELENQRS